MKPYSKISLPMRPEAEEDDEAQEVKIAEDIVRLADLTLASFDENPYDPPTNEDKKNLHSIIDLAFHLKNLHRKAPGGKVADRHEENVVHSIVNKIIKEDKKRRNFTVKNEKTGETIDIHHDVCHKHPAWVHAQLGTGSESELQHHLDQCNVRDWYRGGEYLGPDSTGLGVDRHEENVAHSIVNKIIKEDKKRRNESFSDDGVTDLPEPGELEPEESDPYPDTVTRGDTSPLYALIDQGNAYALERELRDKVDNKTLEAIVYTVGQIGHARSMMDKLELYPGKAGKTQAAEYDREIEYRLQHAKKLLSDALSNAK